VFYCQNDIDYVMHLLNNNLDFKLPKRTCENKTRREKWNFVWQKHTKAIVPSNTQTFTQTVANEENLEAKRDCIETEIKEDKTPMEIEFGSSNKLNSKEKNWNLHTWHSKLTISPYKNSRNEKKQSLNTESIEAQVDEKYSLESLKTTAKKKGLVRKYIYDWQSDFRFSSRFVNTHVVAIITLYHFFVFVLYHLVDFSVLIDNYLPDSAFNASDITLDFGSIACYFGQDFCISSLENLTFLSVSIPPGVKKYGPELKHALKSALIVPACLAVVISMAQILFGIKDFRTHLIQLYKGKCDYLPKRTSLSNVVIAGNFTTFFCV
jgi:hypothetical protein